MIGGGALRTSPLLVGATLVVARVGHANAVHHTDTGDHKGRPYEEGGGRANEIAETLCVVEAGEAGL